MKSILQFFADNPVLTRTAELAVELLFLWILYRIVGRVIDRLAIPIIQRARAGDESRRRQQTQSLSSILRSCAKYFILVLGGVSVLHAVVPPSQLASLVAAGSVFALAVGFGAQKLIRDFVAGLFIVAEDQYAVGDWVTIAGEFGRVEDLGVRITTLRTPDNRLVLVPNGDIAAVANHSRGLLRTRVRLYFGASQEPDRIIRACEGAARECGDEVKCVGLAEYMAGYPDIAVDFDILSAPAQKEAAERTLRLRLLNALAKLGYNPK